MNYILTRTAGALLAFGIFFTISCSTSEPMSSSGGDSPPPSTIEEKLSAVNRQIQQEPENTELRIRKAELLYQQARKESAPSMRQPLYQNLRGELDSAGYRSAPEPLRKNLNEILKKAWSEEQANGVRLLQQDRSEAFDNHFPEIIAHFDNAITLIPDSTVTYSLKATTYYRHGNLGDAIATLEEAVDQSDSPDPDLSEKLAYLYLESGNLSRAVTVYETLVEQDPVNEYLKRGLANAYILKGEHEKAVRVLRELVNRYPARLAYQESLATEIYFVFESEADRLLDQDGNITDTEATDLLAMLVDSQTLFEEFESDSPSSEETIFRLASFYKNSGEKLRALSTLLSASEEITNNYKNQSDGNLNKALPFWERLVELNPENLEYLVGLKEVYTHLGMEEDAQSIERSINF